MFKLFERQPNWTLKQLIQTTDQPEVRKPFFRNRHNKCAYGDYSDESNTHLEFGDILCSNFSKICLRVSVCIIRGESRRYI